MELDTPFCNVEPHVFDFNEPVRTNDTKKVKARELLFNPKRFDLLIKYLYARVKLDASNQQNDPDWIKEVFIEHRRYLNNFHEANYPEFSTGEQFVQAYDKLIDVCASTDNERLRTIPVNEDLTPVDGAHRIAILAALDKEVEIAPFRKKYQRTNYTYDYLFFRRKGMPSEYTDFIALEYVRHAPDVYAMCLFPSCKDKWNEIDAMIRSEVAVYYDKKVAFTKTGKLNFIRNLYRTEPWVGDIGNGFKGARWKMEQCFSKEGGIRVYIVVSDCLDRVVALKKKIRDYCQLGNHSVHSTDVRATTFDLASMTLHDQTVSILNSTEANDFPVYNRLFPVYKNYLENNYLDRNHFCLDGSAILSACSLRDCRDIDFLTSEKEDTLPDFPEDVDCHNDYTRRNGFDKLLKTSIESIVLNPRYHYYHEGYKVMSPQLIHTIKTFRNEPKDVVDTRLVADFEARVKDYRNVLAPSDMETTYDSEWYSRLDSYLRKSGHPLLAGLLNTRFVYTERVSDLIRKWEDFLGVTNRFDPDGLLYFFELLQRIDLTTESAFWRLFECYSANLSSDDENTYVDIFMLLAIFFQEMSCMDGVEQFESSISNFVNLPSVRGNDLLVNVLMHNLDESHIHRR